VDAYCEAERARQETGSGIKGSDSAADGKADGQQNGHPSPKPSRSKHSRN
jgi:hypothetical protein